MTPKAIKASATVALVVFAVSATLLCIALSRTTSVTSQTGYGAPDRATKPMLVGIGN